MSLLLEALKKAEQAKQGGGAPDPESTLHGGEGLSLAPTGTPAPTAPATPAGERTPVTRDRLPDIDHSTLEILSDDLPSATTTREPAATGAPATEQPAAASRRPGARAAAARAPAEAGEDLDREQAGREAARRLFEAKPADYDPRRPFKITLVTLGVAAIAIIVYFWWQTQPRSLQVAQPPAPPTQIAAAPAPANAAPPPAPPATPPAAADPGTATPAAAPPAATAAASGPAPRTAPAPPQPMASRPAPSASSPAVRDRPAAPRRERPQAPAAVRAAPGTDISVSRSISGINAALAEGYAAFQSGDLAAAGRAYQRALAADPRNKDALLGLAAVNLRTGSFKSAEGYYLRVLEIDPRDPDANAGMVSLRGRSDPVQSESRLKTLIAANPDAAALHFALGNQLAVQSRWAEAQAAYFRAVTIEPENPDYAFNLAVSLDQLRQARPALEYYQRALALAGARAASFNKAQVETRIRELQR